MVTYAHGYLIGIKKQIQEDRTRRRNEALSRLKQLDEMEDMRALLEDKEREQKGERMKGVDRQEMEIEADMVEGGQR